MYLTRSHVPRQPITHGGWPFSLRMASIVILVALVTVARPGPVSGQLVTRGQVAHLGLERAWFAQINLDPSGRMVRENPEINSRLGGGTVNYQSRIKVRTIVMS